MFDWAVNVILTEAQDLLIGIKCRNHVTNIFNTAQRFASFDNGNF